MCPVIVKMASITSTTSTKSKVNPVSWSGCVREALSVSGVALICSEYFDADTANTLLELDCVPANDKKMLRSFLKHSHKDRTSGLQCARGEYGFSKRCQSLAIGRLYPRHHPTLGSMSKDIRNALAVRDYWDLDLHNSHPDITRQVAKIYGWSCDTLDSYVADRDAMLRSVKHDYGLTSRNDAKVLVLKVINSGAVPQCVPSATSQFLQKLKKEVTVIANN
jgi:hypothetical protein